MMSLQSLVCKMARRRALTVLGGSLMRRGSTRRGLNLHSRKHWLSTSSKDDYSREVLVEPIKEIRNEPAETEIDDSTSAISTKDRLMGEICKSIHNDVKEILNEEPIIVQKKWKRNLYRRRKERQQKSLFSARQSDGDSAHVKVTTRIDAPRETRLTQDIPPSTQSVESIVSESSPGDTDNQSGTVQPETTVKDAGTSQGASTWNADDRISDEKFISGSSYEEKTETNVSQSFLKLLLQPIEDEALTNKLENVSHVSVSSIDRKTSSQPSSLLDLLSDTETSSSSIDVHVQREDDNGVRTSSEITTTPDSTRTEPASLMDLLNEKDHRDEALIVEESVSMDSMGNQFSSLRNLLNTDDAVDNGTKVEEASTSRLTDDNIERKTANDNVGRNDTEEHDFSDVVDEGLALLLALHDRNWSQMEQVREDEEDASPQDHVIVEEEVLPESEIVEEEFELETSDDTKEMTSYEDYHIEIVDLDLMLENIEELLEEAAFGEVKLSTTDYNAMLIRIATSPLPTDDVVAPMLKVYRHMSELVESGAECSPDATTYTILMIALDRRANAPLSAADICRQMMDSGIELSSEACFHGMSFLNRTNDIASMERLMNLIVDRKTFQVPLWAWMSLLRVYKNENAQQKALDLLERCIETNNDRSVGTVTNLVLETMAWPRRDRGGLRIDRTSLLTSVMEKLATASSGAFGDEVVVTGGERIAACSRQYHVWNRLIILLESEVDRRTNSGWDVVHKAFQSMRNAVQDFWPDSSLLKIGLDAAQVSRDAELAVDLIIRMHNKQMQGTESLESASKWNSDVVGASDDHLKGDGDQSTNGHILSEALDHPKRDFSGMIGNLSEAIDIDSDPMGTETVNDRDQHEFPAIRVPPQAFTAAMRICVATGDANSVNRLLDTIRDSRNTIPRSMKTELYTLALKGFAKVGDSDDAQALLREMQDGGLTPTEEAYGTVIHSLAVANKTNEAIELFKAIASGHFEDDVSPGVSCYNSRMLAHVEAHEWDKALACHEERKDAGIPWSSASLQDVLLACHRTGQKERAFEAVEEALESGMKLSYSCCALSLQVLLGDVLESNNIDEVRHKLREIGEQNDELKMVSLNLNRSLRAAQVEETRHPTKGLKQAEIAARQDKAWHAAHRHLVDFARAIEISENSKVISPA